MNVTPKFFINLLFYALFACNLSQAGKKDSPSGGSVWICWGIHKAFAGVLRVNFCIRSQVQILESKTEFDDLETKKLD